MHFDIRSIAALACLLTVAACTGVQDADLGDPVVQQNVESFQQTLVDNGVTGGSIAGVFRGADTLAYSIIDSGQPGDTPISSSTIFPIWSMSKPITTVAMMILHERGLYAMDDPVSKYIPYFSGLNCKDADGQTYRCENELQIVHLLSHRSGYGYYEEGTGPRTRNLYGNLDEFVRDVAAHPVEFEPGTDYLYGINNAILGRVVEVLTGKEFVDFLSEAIFEPLGMGETKFELSPDDRTRFQVLFKKPGPSEDGTAVFSTAHDELPYTPGTKAQYGGEGLVSTFSDYRRFCEMLLGKGVYNGARILSERSIEMMTEASTPGDSTEDSFDGMDFGFSLFVLSDPALDGTGSSKGIFGWSGYHNTHFWIDYEKDIYGLFMTRATPFSWEIQKQYREAVYRDLN